jgi:hypothetical protein
VILDHKTRARDSMPSLAQKHGTYVQVSVYKLLLDRWLGSNIDDGVTHGPPRAPPFDLHDFFDSFGLDPNRTLGTGVREVLAASGLSPSLCLSDLLNLTLGVCRDLPPTHGDVKVEYELQADGRVRTMARAWNVFRAARTRLPSAWC